MTSRFHVKKMTTTVWKYNLLTTDEQFVLMPRGTELLHVGTQFGSVCLWARVDDQSNPMVRRLILIRGTGHPEAFGKYVGTYQLEGGALVFHCFDGGEKETEGRDG